MKVGVAFTVLVAVVALSAGIFVDSVHAAARVSDACAKATAMAARASVVAHGAAPMSAANDGSMWTNEARKMICGGSFGHDNCVYGGNSASAMTEYGLAGKSWYDGSRLEATGKRRLTFRYMAWSTVWQAYSSVVPHRMITWCGYDAIGSVAALVHHCSIARAWFAAENDLLERDPALSKQYESALASEQGWLRDTHC